MYNILYKYKRCCLYLHEADEKQIVNKCEKNDERGRKCEKTMREAENVRKTMREAENVKKTMREAENVK